MPSELLTRAKEGSLRKTMSQSNLPGSNKGQPPTNLQLRGGAAIVAPPSAFPSGVPGNALIVLPLSQPSDELTEKLSTGAIAVTLDDMWKMLGFNGPAVQVQDQEGRPIAIGLDDLLAGLEQHWQENPEDYQRARIYAQELLKYSRFEQAEKVLQKIVASGTATGDDWLALGVSQLQQEKWEKSEGTLRGAQNLLPENPFPSLHLGRCLKGKGDRKAERDAIERAIGIDGNCVDAWAYLFAQIRDLESEDAALARIKELSDTEANKRRAAPFIALQGVYSAEESTRDKAIDWAKVAVERNPNDPLALISLSALYGQKGDLKSVIETLQPHEGKMASDVRLANNYFEALFQSRDLERVTKLLNALAGSPNKEVKQFALERSRAVAQYLQQQQQKLAGAAANRPS
jgi:tetratricopeptide (TPR) repeat protein